MSFIQYQEEHNNLICSQLLKKFPLRSEMCLQPLFDKVNVSLFRDMLYQCQNHGMIT